MNTDSIQSPPSGFVLAVDDTLAVRVLMKALLMKAGISVQLACDGSEALNAISRDESQIQLVILDLNMPVMTGKELIQELVRQKRYVPILLCSGSVTMMTEAVAQSDGMVIGVVKKPFCIETLRQQVFAALAGGQRSELGLAA